MTSRSVHFSSKAKQLPKLSLKELGSKSVRALSKSTLWETEKDPFQSFQVEVDPCFDLQIKVVKGEAITKGSYLRDLCDTPDPYVILRVPGSANSSKRTSTIDNNTHPIWEESFHFYLDPQKIDSFQLEITLMEANYATDEILGTNTLKLNSLVVDELTEVRFRFPGDSIIYTNIMITKNKHPDLRFSLKLCQDEKNFLIKRRIKVMEHLKSILGEDGPRNIAEVPIIGVIGSGGGFRAMSCLAGVMKALHQMKVIDCATYIAGLSGSSWYISTLYSHDNFPTEFLEVARDQMYESLKESVTNNWKWKLGHSLTYLADMKTKYAMGQPISFTDFFGHLLCDVLLKGNKEKKLSDQQTVLEEGKVPFPLYTCLHAKRNLSCREFSEWVEFSPYEIGIAKYATFMKSEMFGCKFIVGKMIKQFPEVPLHFLQGVWGSAYTILIKRLLNKDKRDNVQIMRDEANAMNDDVIYNDESDTDDDEDIVGKDDIEDNIFFDAFCEIEDIQNVNKSIIINEEANKNDHKQYENHENSSINNDDIKNSNILNQNINEIGNKNDKDSKNGNQTNHIPENENIKNHRVEKENKNNHVAEKENNDIAEKENNPKTENESTDDASNENIEESRIRKISPSQLFHKISGYFHKNDIKKDDKSQNQKNTIKNKKMSFDFPIKCSETLRKVSTNSDPGIQIQPTRTHTPLKRQNCVRDNNKETIWKNRRDTFRKKHAEKKTPFLNLMEPMMMGEKGIFNSRSGRAGEILNPFRGLSLAEAFPLSPFYEEDIDSADGTEGFHPACRVEPLDNQAKKLFVVDSGLAFNSPYPLLLRPQRAVDLYLSFDFSQREHDDERNPKELFRELILAEKWAHQNKVLFPPIKSEIKQYEDDYEVREVYVFKCTENPHCPIILHFPLVNNKFKKYSKPGIPRETKEELDFADFSIFDDVNAPYYSTNFTYTEQQFDRLVKLMEFNTLSSEDVIKDEIIKLIKLKRELIDKQTPPVKPSFQLIANRMRCMGAFQRRNGLRIVIPEDDYRRDGLDSAGRYLSSSSESYMTANADITEPFEYSM